MIGRHHDATNFRVTITMNYHQLLARKERCHRCQIYSEGFTITFDDDSLDRVVVVSHAKSELNNFKGLFQKNFRSGHLKIGRGWAVFN